MTLSIVKITNQVVQSNTTCHDHESLSIEECEKYPMPIWAINSSPIQDPLDTVLPFD